MNSKKEKWYAVTVAVPRHLTEAAEFAFNGTDSLGTEVDLLSNKDSDQCSVTAYFSSPPDDNRLRGEFLKAARVYDIGAKVDLELKHSIVESQDWLAEWKKYWRPVEVGRFVIAAPWHEVRPEEKALIVIEPNMAFGTGTHETTRLVLEAISVLYRPDQTFLDVGTGTGILAIAAAKTRDNRAKITAVEIDPEAVAIARLNARQNDIGQRIEFKTGSIDGTEGPYDFVCANLTADVIIDLLPVLINATKETLVLSGILAEQEGLVTDRFPAGTRFEISRAGEWIAIIINKN